MGLRSFKSIPQTTQEWDKFFRSAVVEPSDNSIGADQLKSDAVTNAKLRNSSGNSVIGRSADSLGDPADIVIGSNQLLVNRAGVLAGGALIETDIPDEIARSSDVTAEIGTSVASGIAAHEAATDPHPQYMTAAEVTSATDALNLASGVYTPTRTSVTNLDGSTGYQCQYLRVGTVVTVSGKVDINPTATGSTELALSLPVASNFAASEDCAGTAFASGVAGQGAAILADVVNNRARLLFVTTDTTNQEMLFQFTYRIIA